MIPVLRWYLYSVLQPFPVFFRFVKLVVFQIEYYNLTSYHCHMHVVSQNFTWAQHQTEQKISHMKDLERKKWTLVLAVLRIFVSFPVLMATGWQHTYGWCSRIPVQGQKTQREESRASYTRCWGASWDPSLQTPLPLGSQVSVCTRRGQRCIEYSIYTRHSAEPHVF